MCEKAGLQELALLRGKVDRPTDNIVASIERDDVNVQDDDWPFEEVILVFIYPITIYCIHLTNKTFYAGHKNLVKWYFSIETSCPCLSVIITHL